MSTRPKLVVFRVEAFSSENRAEGAGPAWEITLSNTIEVGLAVPTVPGSILQAVVKLRLASTARSTQDEKITAGFNGEYVGRFNYPEGSAESEISELISTDDHQYLLAAQVFPLAMSHFRRELLSTGFDAKNLPLGI